MTTEGAEAQIDRLDQGAKYYEDRAAEIQKAVRETDNALPKEPDDSSGQCEFFSSGIAAFELLAINDTKNHVPLREEHFDTRVFCCQQPMVQRVDCP